MDTDEVLEAMMGSALTQRIHLLENPCLEVVILRRGLDNHIRRLEGIVSSRAFDPSERSILFSWRYLAFGDHGAETALDSVNARFDSLLADVQQNHIDAFRGRNLGDPTAHDTGPDYPNCAYRHRRALPSVMC